LRIYRLSGAISTAAGKLSFLVVSEADISEVAREGRAIAIRSLLVVRKSIQGLIVGLIIRVLRGRQGLCSKDRRGTRKALDGSHIKGHTLLLLHKLLLHRGLRSQHCSVNIEPSEQGGNEKCKDGCSSLHTCVCGEKKKPRPKWICSGLVRRYHLTQWSPTIIRCTSPT